MRRDGPSLETWEGRGEDEDNAPELFEARRRKGKKKAERRWVLDGWGIKDVDFQRPMILFLKFS